MSGHQDNEVACRDNNNAIGTFGCDKRTEPGCCSKFFCAECVVTNYEGCSVLAIVGWIAAVTGVGYGLFGCYVCCCYAPPLLGVHYGNRRANAVGGPVHVVQNNGKTVAAGSGRGGRGRFVDSSDDEYDV